MKVSWDKEHGWHIEHEGEIIAEVSDEAVYDKFSVPRSKERYAAESVILDVVFANLERLESKSYNKWIVGELLKVGE